MTRANTLSRVAAYCLAWTVAGLFLFSRDLPRGLLRADPTPLTELLASWLLGSYISAALTPAIFWLGRRWPIERETWRPRVLLHLFASAVFYPIDVFPHANVYAVLNPVAGAIDMLRDAVLRDAWPNPAVLLGQILWLGAGLMLSYRLFRRLAPTLVERM